MDLHRIAHTELAAYTYILSDQASGVCVVIDPVRTIEPIVSYFDDHNLEPTHILETHVHADFVSGAPDLKAYYRNKPVIYSSVAGGKEWLPAYADQKVTDGTSISIGDILLKAIHTPGHTPEHLSWLGFDTSRSSDIPLFAFSGDLIFVGSVGRPDLLGPQEAEALRAKLYETLFQKIAPLPDSLELYPAHGAGSLCGKEIGGWSSTTLGYERRFNPFLQQDKEKWFSLIQKDIPAPPQSFTRIKKMNLRGPFSPSDAFHKPPRLDAIPDQAVFVDIRDPHAFSEEHIVGALNIPMGQAFCNWAGMVVPAERPLVLVVNGAPDAEPAAKLLWTVGFNSIAGYIVHDDATQRVLGLSVTALPNPTPQEAPQDYIVDVRTPAEWHNGHIPHAHHVELATIAQKADSLPRDKQITLICGSGYRSSVAASYLQHLGFEHVAHIAGGMNGWSQARLPIEKG